MYTKFPFTAIVGQDEMKLALILNAIDPSIGGLILMGDRGTGKSTAVRSMTEILPVIEVTLDDPFNSHPSSTKPIGADTYKFTTQTYVPTIFKKPALIELPLGATEDKVCGSINVEKTLAQNSKVFEPGLLAKANRGILYIDEVNLLEDHLVDILLDSAACGWNTVERDGISIRHPAQFILIGSGNPEEGDLRPQLLDRFGMYSEVNTIKDPELRSLAVEQRLLFEADPHTFVLDYIQKETALRDKLARAQALLPQVTLSYDLRTRISQICSDLNIDGLRGDLVVHKASKAHAAYNSRTVVRVEDIQVIADMCLRHRLPKTTVKTLDHATKIHLAFEKIFTTVKQ
uniref:magnesium chelatase n=1 Tax=Cryptomonas sp. CCAC 1634B TaxID=2051848 RepID=A0A679CAI5_9CRYP|nr:Mg chelatase subunit E [Cryptomonas sp. CCAC 1634B]